MRRMTVALAARHRGLQNLEVMAEDMTEDITDDDLKQNQTSSAPRLLEGEENVGG